jgi:hypothetical protein
MVLNNGTVELQYLTDVGVNVSLSFDRPLLFLAWMSQTSTECCEGIYDYTKGINKWVRYSNTTSGRFGTFTISSDRKTASGINQSGWSGATVIYVTE